MNDDTFLNAHNRLTRRFFLQSGLIAAEMLIAVAGERIATAEEIKKSPDAKVGAQPKPYFTPAKDFRDVSRGTPLPHTLPEEKKREVGLTRDTWQMDVISDPDNPSKLGKEFKRSDGTAINFERLLSIGERHAVRFAKVMTCLNIGCPLGMGLWEGVPLREVVWLTEPKENLRRVFYYGYHNDDPKQIFRSSLPVGRILEDLYDLPPVILCYKLNGEWLDSERGGPVRMIVPEAYGFKSVKWLTHLVLSNIAHSNDTYAEKNNDIDSPLKTFAAVLSCPTKAESGNSIPVSGYVQVGVSGLTKVQVSLVPKATPDRADDRYFASAPWVDAEILGNPSQWSALEQGKVPANTHGFNSQGQPLTWPMRLTKAHWGVILPPQARGEYVFRCRSIDDQGNAQPMPRPFRKSGHATIETILIQIE